MSDNKEYAARFWRYGKGCGFNGDVSGPVRIMASNFHDAMHKAQFVLEGMKSIAAPDVFAKDKPTYEIHSVTMAGVHATPCEGRLNIWAATDLPREEGEGS